MVVELTPALRRRVLSLSSADRVTLLEEITLSLTPAARRVGQDRLEELDAAMKRVSGVDVRIKTRVREYTEARTVFAYVLTLEGYNNSQIGKYLGLDHSTVHHMKGNMAAAFAHPRHYNTLLNTYNKFIQAIV